MQLLCGVHALQGCYMLPGRRTCRCCVVPHLLLSGCSHRAPPSKLGVQGTKQLLTQPLLLAQRASTALPACQCSTLTIALQTCPTGVWSAQLVAHTPLALSSRESSGAPMHTAADKQYSRQPPLLLLLLLLLPVRATTLLCCRHSRTSARACQHALESWYHVAVGAAVAAAGGACIVHAPEGVPACP